MFNAKNNSEMKYRFTIICLLFSLICFPQFRIDTIILIDSNINFRSICNGKIYKEVYTGNHWSILDESEPLFLPGIKGSYDERGQADPTVINNEMWFDALNGNGQWDSIGYAVLKGGNWIKQGTVLGRGSGWDNKSIHHPVCIKHKRVYYLYYSGSSKNDPHIVKDIGLATSKDRIHFIKYENNPVLKTDNEEYLRPSRPLIIDRKWYMFYWYYDGKFRYMGLAESDNGFDWVKKGKFFGDESCGKCLTNITGSDVMAKGKEIYIYYSTVFPAYFCLIKLKTYEHK
jgi:hypothetical protein